MQRYFFVVRKGSRSQDTTEVELSDLNAAKAKAVVLMGEDLRQRPHELWADEEWHLDVTDERGLILFSIYSAAIEAAAVTRQLL